MIKIKEPKEELKKEYLKKIKAKTINNTSVKITNNFLKFDVDTSSNLTKEFLEYLFVGDIFNESNEYYQNIKDYINISRYCNGKISVINKIYYNTLLAPLTVDDKDQIKALLIKFNDDIKKRIKYVQTTITPSLRRLIINGLGTNVCPYCNRAFISNYRIKRTNYLTADLDHFMPKSLFPLFALSLYNFIPSCQVCNSRMKLAADEDILYPYKNSFGDDAKFEIEYKSSDKSKELILSTIGKEKDEASIKLKYDKTTEIGKKIEASNNLFNIENLYQYHIKFALDLKRRKYCYGETNEKAIDKLFKDKNIDITPEQKKSILYGYNFSNEEEYSILEKLAKDILEE